MTFENLNFEVDATGIVAKLRAASGLTQREFAERIGMNQSQLARIESGKQFPKIETLAKIASGAGYALQIHFLPNTNEQISPISIIFGDTPMADSSEYSVYFASIQQGLLSERENFLWVMHDIRSSLRSRNIHPEVIPNYLGLAKACHDQCLGKSWTLIDIIEESSKNGIAVDSPNVFTSLFDILKDERRKYRSFFTDTQGLASVLQEQQDIGNVESKTVRVISNHLEVFEKETEDELLEYVESHPNIRFAAIKLVIPEHSIRELNDYDDKQLKIYRKALDDERRKRKKVLDKLERFDRLLAYRKSEIRMSNHLVASYADRLMRQQQSEFIGKSIMEPKMNTATNLDEVRQQAIAQLEALQKYLNEKGRTKEAEDISEEVTKIRDNTYQIAFVATFSSGKSTLINAMLGNDILPSMAKPTTGRLTFIDDREGDVTAQVEVSKEDDQRVIVLSYRDPQDLQKYLNKYLRNGWIGKAEVYSEEKSLQFDSPVDFVKSAFDPVSEANDIHANQAKLTLNSGVYSFALTDLSQVELGSFINNDAVEKLNIQAPVKHLTKQVRLDGIQFVDTPGTNAARHANHKRITFDFISKANAVVYVIDFTKAFTDDDAVLLDEIRQQRESNPRFCEKLFFAVNKIDQDNSNGQNLQDTISSIYNTLTNDYGFDIQPDRVIGIAAFPALLYRMKQDNLLQNYQKKALNAYTVKFLDDYWDASIEERVVAEKNVLKMSNIEELESALVKYLSNNNKTQQIILDSIRRGLIFAQSCEGYMQKEIALFHVPLKKLDALTKKINVAIEEAKNEKDLIGETLANDQEDTLKVITDLYSNFEKDVKSLIANVFNRQNIKQPVKGLTSDQLKTLQKSVNKILELEVTTNKNDLDNILNKYQDIINEIVKSMYVVFESKLKDVCDREKLKIVTRLNNIADRIISRLEQDLNISLGINARSTNIENIGSMPKIKLPSIRDIVDQEIYESEKRATGKKKRPSNSDETIFTKFFFVKPDLVRSRTQNAIKLSLRNGKSKAIEISKSEILKVYQNTTQDVNQAIDFTKKFFNEKIEERRVTGDNVIPKLEELEMDLDMLTQTISSLNDLYNFVETTQVS